MLAFLLLATALSRRATPDFLPIAVWYGGGNRWIRDGERSLPVYDIRYLESADGVTFPRAGRAIAGLRPAWSDNISVAFVAGKGAALRDLLFALRYEADADGLDHVTIALPRRHPAAVDMNACGYDLVNADDNAGVYGLKL